MNLNEAVEFMKQSVSVQDWNNRRTTVFQTMEGDFRDFIQVIDGVNEDGTSLIVKTLGKDEPTS